MKKRILTPSILFLTLCALSAPAMAVTAGEVVERMSDDERGGYFDGAIGMAAWLHPDKADCIYDWYYYSDGKGPREVAAVFQNYRDKPAAALLKVLIDRHCGNKNP